MAYIPLICGIIGNLCGFGYYFTINSGKYMMPSVPWPYGAYELFSLLWLVLPVVGLAFGVIVRGKCKGSAAWRAGMALCALGALLFVLVAAAIAIQLSALAQGE